MRWVMYQPLDGSKEQVHTDYGTFVPGVAQLVFDEIALALLPHEVVDRRGRSRQVGAMGFVEVDPPQAEPYIPKVINVEKRAGSIASALKRKGKHNGK